MTFDEALAFAWLPQNDGQPWHVSRGDAGGATAWGVTTATWEAWGHLHSNPYGLARASKADLADLLCAWFWKPAGAGLPSGIDLIVFDFGITSGPARSVRFLQAALDLVQDGDIGPVTRAAAAAFDQPTLCQRLHDRQAAFYRADVQAAQFPGWFRRNDDRLAAALRAIGAPAEAMSR
jgi:lysozyme family protein